MQPQKALLSETGFAADSLSTPAQALAAFFARVAITQPGVETIARDESRGRVLASSLTCAEDQPSSTRSAMDGFAIVASDAPGTFAIAGSVEMGASPTPALARGTAMRIPTGGALPHGADAVVPIESTRVAGDTVAIEQSVAAGENAIERAADMRAGEIVLEAGAVVAPAAIGLMAALGIASVRVYRRPLVGIVSSGDEIVPPARTPTGAQVRDSNRYAIAAALEAMGARVKHVPTVGDRPDALAAALRDMLEECDAVVASGGSSVGAHDRLPDAVAQFDPGTIVHGLRIKPGKPALLGASGNKPIVGLPGNPTSALIVLDAVAAPIFYALARQPHRPVYERCRLEADVGGRAGWTTYVPVRIHGETARPLELRSFSVRLLAAADGYLTVAPDAHQLRAGDEALVRRFLT